VKSEFSRFKVVLIQILLLGELTNFFSHKFFEELNNDQSYPSMTNEQLQLLDFQITEYHKLMLNKQNIIASEQNSPQVTAFQKHLHLKKLNGIEEESSKKKHDTFSRVTELEINTVMSARLRPLAGSSLYHRPLLLRPLAGASLYHRPLLLRPLAGANLYHPPLLLRPFGRCKPLPPAAAAPPVGRGQPLPTAAAAPPVGRGQPLPAAAAAPPIGGGLPLPPAAAAPPVGGRLACHLMVINDMFNFLTRHVRTAAIIRSFETENGFLTTAKVPG
jgi:hypothetical protein